MAGRRRRSHGEGTIYWDEKAKRWVVAVTATSPSGKQQRVKRKRRTKTEAVSCLQELQAARVSGRLAYGPLLPLSDWLDKWLATYAKPNLAPTTLDCYRQATARIKKQLGGLAVRKVLPVDVEELYAKLEAAGLSVSVRRHCHYVLKGAFKSALANRLVPVNPMLEVKRPAGRGKRGSVWEKHELARFLEHAAGDRLFALFLLAAVSGMRQGELFAVRWIDLDISVPRVRVCRKVVHLGGEFLVSDPKTESGIRTIELPEFMRDALLDHKARMLDEGLAGCELVFPDSRGGFLRRQNVQRRHFKPLIDAAGIPEIRFHDLRHSHATLLLLSGESPNLVQARMGHSDVATTLRIYGHLFKRSDREAADRIADPRKDAS